MLIGLTEDAGPRPIRLMQSESYCDDSAAAGNEPGQPV